MTWFTKSGLICLAAASAAIAVHLSAGESALDASGKTTAATPADAPAESREKGRYQSAIAGSRGAQRFATAFRIDTATGKTWRSLLYFAELEPWLAVKEDPASLPEESNEVGRFELTASMVSDRTGQDMASAVRIDTHTGRTWAMRADPPEPKWRQIDEGKEAKKKP